MDGQDYLNQISASVRPEKKARTGLIGSPIFKVILGGVIALIIIIIFGSVISGGKTGLNEQNVVLKLRIDNTLTVISSYQSSVKSSELRSDSASLYSVLSNTSRELTNYMTEKFNYKDNDKTYKTLQEDANLYRDELESDLFEAKINGILDKVYAHKMAYEISAIMAKESSIYNASGDASLQSLLATSYNSLDNLYNKFNDFSETK